MYKKIFEPINIVLTVLTILITVLAIVNIFDQFRIINTNFLNTAEPLFTLHFSRPISNELNAQDFITVSPAIQYSVFHSGSNLEIRFSEPLQPDTNYEVRVNSEITDIFGSKLTNHFLTNFKTTEERLLFLQTQKGNQDKIFSWGLGDAESTEIYSGSKIYSYRQKGAWLAVISSTNTHNVLSLANIQTKETIKILDHQPNIFAAEFEPNGDLLFLAQTMTRDDQGNAIPEGKPIFYRYELANHEAVKLNWGSSIQFPDEFILDLTGSTVGVRDGLDNSHYLFSTRNPTELLPIGKFVKLHGFNFNRDELVGSAINADPLQLQTELVKINTNNKQQNLIGKNNFVVDAQYIGTTNNLIIRDLYNLPKDSSGLYRLRLLNGKWQWQTAGRSVSEFTINKSGTILAGVEIEDDQLLVTNSREQYQLFSRQGEIKIRQGESGQWQKVIEGPIGYQLQFWQE